jgi:hypothetical protein
MKCGIWGRAPLITPVRLSLCRNANAKPMCWVACMSARYMHPCVDEVDGFFTVFVRAIMPFARVRHTVPALIAQCVGKR